MSSSRPGFAFLAGLALAGTAALAALPRPPAPASDAAALADRIEALAARLDALEARPGPPRAVQAGLPGTAPISRSELLAPGRGTPRDPAAEAEGLRRDILLPVFLLAGRDAVGSGVLFASEPLEDGRSRYWALTAWHVVRDILEEQEPPREAREVDLEAILERRGRSLHLAARMAAADPARDLALLRLDTAEDLRPLARLAPPERARELRVFTGLYTVGCPLGTAPQATRGQLTREHWPLDGQDWWMVSTPAYFGNSGGGVFLEEGHELVGIYARIYTYGSFRPQVITHMGLVTRLEEIHAWLRETGLLQP